MSDQERQPLTAEFVGAVNTAAMAALGDVVARRKWPRSHAGSPVTVNMLCADIARLNLELASTISEHETVTAALLMRVEGLKAALQEMLQLHGKPHREEWLNQPAYEYAVAVHERAHVALAAGGSQ